MREHTAGRENRGGRERSRERETWVKIIARVSGVQIKENEEKERARVTGKRSKQRGR